MNRRLAVVSIAVILSAVFASEAFASYHHHGFQYFTSSASEKYGARGWLRTTNPDINDFHTNFSLATIWIVDEPNYAGPWVEGGWYKGVGVHDVSAPTYYLAYNDSESGSSSGYYEWDDYNHTLDLGSPDDLHKYGTSRTGHNNNTGTTEWTWYFDGNVVVAHWLDRPDQGHPEAGGEVLCGFPSPAPSQKPNMNARGRNNGTSDDSCYWCFKNNESTWYRWTPSYAANTDTFANGNVTFTQSSPLYSVFDATGE